MNGSVKWILISSLAVVIAIAFIVPNVAISEQTPPPTDAEGTPFLHVNINPTNVPPVVNISPRGRVPEIDIRRMPAIDIQRMPDVDIGIMPEVSVRPRGCADPGNFQTDIATTIPGPFIVTYINLAEGIEASLGRRAGESVGVDLNASTALATALYLGRGQTLTFSESVLYSGCTPGQ